MMEGVWDDWLLFAVADTVVWLIVGVNCGVQNWLIGVDDDGVGGCCVGCAVVTMLTHVVLSSRGVIRLTGLIGGRLLLPPISFVIYVWL